MSAQVTDRVRWLMVLGETIAHAIVAETASTRGWRPLCQQSDISSVLMRDARDGLDTFCSTCRTVYASRIRMALRQLAGQR